jgi:uncharacterized membrane protein
VRKLRGERGLVGKAAVVILVGVIVVGLAGIDGGSILFAKLQISDTADVAAIAAEQSYASTHDVQAAKVAAVSAAHQRDPQAHVSGFRVSPDGRVEVTLKKVASTLFVRRVGFLKHFAVVTATGRASP